MMFFFYFFFRLTGDEVNSRRLLSTWTLHFAAKKRSIFRGVKIGVFLSYLNLFLFYFILPVSFSWCNQVMMFRYVLELQELLQIVLR